MRQGENPLMAQNIIAVFARAPVAGEVKTRLAKSVGDVVARDLYCAMLQDVLSSARSAASQMANCVVVISYTPQDAFSRADDSLNNFWQGAHIPQNGGDLGERLLRSFAVLQKRGARKIVVIGSDAPDLPPNVLTDALQVLDDHDFVFGPSGDGGFYLMGTSETVDARWFENVRWSNENTLDDVLANIGAQRVYLLPLWHDVDTLDDLHTLLQHLQEGESSAPETSKVLRLQDL